MQSLEYDSELSSVDNGNKIDNLPIYLRFSGYFENLAVSLSSCCDLCGQVRNFKLIECYCYSSIKRKLFELAKFADARCFKNWPDGVHINYILINAARKENYDKRPYALADYHYIVNTSKKLFADLKNSGKQQKKFPIHCRILAVSFCDIGFSYVRVYDQE